MPEDHDSENPDGRRDENLVGRRGEIRDSMTVVNLNGRRSEIPG